MPMASHHFTVSYGKEVENRRVLSLVLNVRRHCEDVTSDGRLHSKFLPQRRGTLGRRSRKIMAWVQR